MAGPGRHGRDVADGRHQCHLRGAVGPFNPGPSWQIKGSGDFNGDGKSDILWQGSDGTPAIWLMDGTNAMSVGAAGSFNPDRNWQVKGSGDFNGDRQVRHPVAGQRRNAGDLVDGWHHMPCLSVRPARSILDWIGT
jgi:hypothetical protein